MKPITIELDGETFELTNDEWVGAEGSDSLPANLAWIMARRDPLLPPGFTQGMVLVTFLKRTGATLVSDPLPTGWTYDDTAQKPGTVTQSTY